MDVLQQLLLTFELLLRVQIDLLRLSDFFEDVLDDVSIPGAHITNDG